MYKCKSQTILKDMANLDRVKQKIRLQSARAYTLPLDVQIIDLAISIMFMD